MNNQASLPHLVIIWVLKADVQTEGAVEGAAAEEAEAEGEAEAAVRGLLEREMKEKESIEQQSDEQRRL